MPERRPRNRKPQMSPEEARALTDRIKANMGPPGSRGRNGKAERLMPTDVYFAYDVEGQLLYVGISLDLANRLKGHRRESDWWPLVARIDVEHYSGRVLAQVREMTAIHEMRPPYNRHMNRR